MISINTSSSTTVKMTDPSVVSTCLLGVSNLGTGLPGIAAVRPAVLPVPRGSSHP